LREKISRGVSECLSSVSEFIIYNNAKQEIITESAGRKLETGATPRHAF